MYSKEFLEIRNQLFSVMNKFEPNFNDESQGYWILIQNMFLAHRKINKKTNDSLKIIRHEITKKILEECDYSAIETKKNEENFFIFPNGLKDRKIAHTRFNFNSQNISKGDIYNYSFDKKGRIVSTYFQ